MEPKIVVLAVFVAYFLGYKLYAGFLSRKIFQLRKKFKTPAHALRDDVDYVPSRNYVLLGHHYASITGLAPILGPAVAVIWGWMPALLWVVLGTLLIGAVHDFSALVVSIRAKGLSIGSITEYLIGKRAKLLFLLIIFFLIALAMGVFVLVLGKLFSPAGFPEVIAPSAMIMVVAMVMGYLVFKKGFSMRKVGIIAFLIVLGSVWWGTEGGLLAASDIVPEAGTWKIILLGYAFLASVLPVWLLLQNRDYLNSLLLVLGLVVLYVGFFATSPISFSAPPLQIAPKNAPSIFPFVFIVIACGAVSGFHALVSSGTSAKQINKETDARIIGYGGMIGESILGLIAILATTTVFESASQWQAEYGDWQAVNELGNKVGLFINGGTTFASSLGLPKALGQGLIAFVVVSFALTSLDSATRLLRYNIEELASFIPNKSSRSFFQNRYIASLIAVVVIGFFAFYKINGQPAGLALWQLFGTTNQLLGALALLVVSIYLFSRGKNPLYTMLPMIFLLVATLTAMGQKVMDFIETPGSNLLLVISIILLLMTGWLIVEAVIAIWRYRTKKVEKLDILD